MIMTNRRRLKIGALIGFVLLVLCLIPAGSAHAVPFSGDYLVTSGDLAGSTFTVDSTSGLLSHWNLIFPLTFTSTIGIPAYTFTDPNITDPSGGIGNPFLSQGVVDSNVLIVFIPDLFQNTQYDFSASADRTYSAFIAFQGFNTGSGVFVPVPEPGSVSTTMIALLALAGAYWWTHRREWLQRG